MQLVEDERLYSSLLTSIIEVRFGISSPPHGYILKRDGAHWPFVPLAVEL